MLTKTKDACGCGNCKGKHELCCKHCWIEIPGKVKRLLSDGDVVESERARRQIRYFSTKRKQLACE